jgi:hypothetical protein
MANEKEKIQLSQPAPAMAPLQRPSLPWRVGSSLIMGLTGTLSRGFLYGLNSVEAIGLQKFLKILDEREDVEKRTKGLLTGTALLWPSQPHVRILTLLETYSLQSR